MTAGNAEVYLEMVEMVRLRTHFTGAIKTC